MKGGLVGVVTPRRFNPNGENTKKGDQAISFTPGKDREIMTEAALSSININAISSKPTCKTRQSVKPNQANSKQTKQEQTPIKDGNPTVVWNNAIFQSEEDEVWGVRACSSSSTSESPSQSVAEVSSNAMGNKGQDKKELHSTIAIKKLPSSLPIPSAESNPEARSSSPDVESIASSTRVPIHIKQSAQPIKKVLFSTQNVDQIPTIGESGDHKDNIDSGIEEIEKEISRLTEKLERLKLQQAAKQKNQEAQFSEPQKELSSPKKTGKVGEPQGCIAEEPKSSEKPRRGRIVSAKFLQWDSSKKEQKPFESSKKGKGGISPKIQRRAASLGPAEHLRFSQISVKCKGDEHGVQKSNPGSARKWLRGSDNTKSTDIMRRLSLSPIPQHPIESKGSTLRSAGLGRSLSARKPASTPLKELARSAQWLHPKKLFSASDAKRSINTNTLSLSSKPCPEQPQKPSPSLKNARFVASRYGQALTPSKERAAKTPQSSLSSLRNAHGKRIFPEDELEHVNGKMDNNSYKKRTAAACSPNVRNPQTEKTVVTSRSRTPGKSATRLELKKTGGVLSKDGKSTGTLARYGARETNNQQKGTQNRAVVASISNVIQDNPLERANQESNVPDATTTYVFSAGIKSPDTLERNRMQLPRIRTIRSAAQSPRNSGCIKRAVDSVGKKSFFASEDNIITDLPDKSSEREIVDDIKHAFSFEDEEVER
ncbi:uncharacterized protein LOC131060694 isoform X2 [Cryptomeria japonica]|uniref:uncharacterized protein LOC131060694 isoform X2 n=1 Tax=Cryptomeria japonica TaxID=3369 RepID=UPI0027DA8A82|nr:uncharacterized protein LOC131060694 isoform X2 [Cryptomeria japonica]